MLAPITALAAMMMPSGNPSPRRRRSGSSRRRSTSIHPCRRSSRSHTTHATSTCFFVCMTRTPTASCTRCRVATSAVRPIRSSLLSTPTFPVVRQFRRRRHDRRELSATPEATTYAERFRAYSAPAGAATAFKYTQLRTNAVARWEYRPGSTLFLVWSHGREDASDQFSNQSWTRDYRDLFALHPDNTFVDKAAYLFSRYGERTVPVNRRQTIADSSTTTRAVQAPPGSRAASTRASPDSGAHANWSPSGDQIALHPFVGYIAVSFA